MKEHVKERTGYDIQRHQHVQIDDRFFLFKKHPVRLKRLHLGKDWPLWNLHRRKINRSSAKCLNFQEMLEHKTKD